MNRGLLLLLACALLPGYASVRTLDAAKPGAPIIYSGTRLDWYTLQGGCCPVDRFGAEAPRYPGLDLPFAAELSLLFRGDLAVVAEVVRRYPSLLGRSSRR